MRLLFNLLAMAAVALGLGFWLSWFALTEGRDLGAVNVGPWQTWPDIGTANPEPYTRAYLARSGILPLGRSEGIQFVAARDSDGKAIDPGCTYLIAGRTPLASFWTLTAATADHRLVLVPDTPLFVDSTHIARGSEGTVSVRIGPSLAPGNWLQTDGETPYRIFLTLYDSAVFSGLGSDISAMPTISREAC